MTSQAKLTKAGHTLCVGLVETPQANRPGGPLEWVWWVRDPSGAMIGEQQVLCYYDIDDSELLKAYSGAVHVLGEKGDAITAFDDLEWSSP